MKYEYWFAALRELNGRKKDEIRGQVSSAQELYYIEEKEWSRFGCEEKVSESIQNSKQNWDLEKEYEVLLRKRIRLITLADSSYPTRLREIPSPPYAIYVKGKLPEERKFSVAIVGARECSAYGMRMAQEFGAQLSKAGVQIISGMARGIDSYSQESALYAGGESYAVLGCGVDVCYPRERIELYTQLERQGGILSEQLPGTKPLPRFFPARNRIISGLADAVLVMEAKEKSGSLITADMALEQGKDVYALPGPVTSSLSRGCNMLIKQGAGILLSPEDFLKEAEIFCEEEVKNLTENKILLETTENIVYSCLDFYPISLGELAGKTKLSIPALTGILIRLELLGYIKEISKNYYMKVK